MTRSPVIANRTRRLGTLAAVASVLIVVPAMARGQTQNRPAELADSAEFGRFVDSVVIAHMTTRRIPGVAFVFVKDGRVFTSRGYGFADLDTRRAVRPESTVFRIGSISKLFTATAVMQLADAGRIDLNTDVNRYLRRVQVPPTFARPITPAHLLSHTAGLDEIRPGTQAPSADAVSPLADFLRPRLVRVRAPGELPAYSTYGITLAGLLVEEVSGQSFQAYLRQHIWTPLLMHNTGITVTERTRAQLAVAYEYRDSAYVRQPYEWYHTTPASAINATALDMARFLLALLEDGRLGDARILGAAAAREMQRPQGRGHPDVPGFGHGFLEADYGGVRVVGHDGAVAGLSAGLVLFPEHRSGFFVASQREANGLSNALKAAIIERYYWAAVAPPAGPFTAADNAKFAGTYRWNVYCHSCGSAPPLNGPSVGVDTNGHLRFAGQEWVRTGPLLFHRVDGARVMGFREDSAGRVTHLFIDGPVTFESVRR